jgi:hypothetical protein
MNVQGVEYNRCLMIGLLCLVLLLCSVPRADAQGSGLSAVERLQSAIAHHPDDPDLIWALARKLARIGRVADAMKQTRDFLARWPRRRPHARIEIARSLLEAGANTEALVLLDEELREKPAYAIAHFYRGIALRAEGLVVESNSEFRIAGRLDPSLRAETMLVRALGLFDLGEDDGAVDLLRQILELAPESESAIRARLLLRQRELMDLQRPWRLDAYAGFEWDSNVSLENAGNEVPASNRQDVLGVWGLGATLRALTTERGSLTVGYRFDQSRHDDLTRFDVLTNTGLVSGNWRVGQRSIMRLDAIAWNTRQDGNDELTGGSIRPNLLVSLGPRAGAIRAFVQFEILDYARESAFEFLERDGYTVGGGLEYFRPLPLANSWISTAASFQQYRTQADSSGGPDGFDGDYDYDSLRIGSRVVLPIPLEIGLRIEAGYSYDDYHNDNLLHALSTVPNPQVRKRRDHIASSRIVLSREIVAHVEFEVYWRGIWRMSNVSLFDYNKHVVGAVFRVSTD